MKKIRILLSLSLVMVAVLVGILLYLDQQIRVELVGDDHLVLNYPEKYVETGAKVFFKDRQLQEATILPSSLEDTTLGEYVVEYEYKLLNIHKKAKRTIVVVDQQEPQLQLLGEVSMQLEQGVEFEEPGFEALDNYDGDLTSQVIVKMPEEIEEVGTHEIEYEVIDSSGNSQKAIRTIEVTKKTVVTPPTPPTPPKPVDAGVIYLTFDDGPHGINTAKVLDILKQEEVKATFFVVGVGPDELIKRAHDEGHTIGLHTYTHKYNESYASVNCYYADLNKISDRVESIIGKKSYILRFPGGSSNAVSRRYSLGIMTTLTKDVINRGYRYFDWNVSGQDAERGATSASVYQNVIKDLSKNRSNNVLLHDIQPHTVAALRDIIRYAKANGYRFEPITMETPMIRHRLTN